MYRQLNSLVRIVMALVSALPKETLSEVMRKMLLEDLVKLEKEL